MVFTHIELIKMIGRMRYNTDLDRLRSYSSVFSRSVFSRLTKFDDLSAINQVGRAYDREWIDDKMTYAEYLDWMYKALSTLYRTEYVYKNVLTNRIVSKNRGRNISIFNEFRVGDSIADIATFNGSSCVYEIKTELDSPKRLEGQQESYFKFFQECYLVVPKGLEDEYLNNVDDRMGIKTVNAVRGSISISDYRKAEHMTDNLDVDTLMRVLWIKEYEGIVRHFFGKLPDVGYFEMYDACKELMRKIPVAQLSKMVVEVIKQRKKNDLLYHNDKKYLTQICLALNFNMQQYVRMCNNLNKTILL